MKLINELQRSHYIYRSGDLNSPPVYNSVLRFHRTHSFIEEQLIIASLKGSLMHVFTPDYITIEKCIKYDIYEVYNFIKEHKEYLEKRTGVKINKTSQDNYIFDWSENCNYEKQY